MFLNILSVSVVCVLLAYNGWEPDDSHIGLSVDSPALLRIDNQSADVQFIYIPHRSVNGTACQTTSLYDGTDTKKTIQKSAAENQISSYDKTNADFVNGPELTENGYPLVNLPLMDLAEEDNMSNGDDDDDDEIKKDKVPDLINTTMPMLTLRDTIASLRGSTAMQPIDDDYRSVREEKSAVFSSQIIVNSRSGRVKNNVLLVELRLLVPFLIIMIYIREREAQAAQLREMRMLPIQTRDFAKRDDAAIIKTQGQGDCSLAQKWNDKTAPKVEQPGRQQRRRGRRGRHMQTVSCSYRSERKRPVLG